MQGIDGKKYILETADDCICDFWVGCFAAVSSFL
jgi:hypothetical protein